MSAPAFNWTPAAIADLTRMRSEGVNINTIARHLGVSRGAVAGKALRLGLSEPRSTPITPLPAWKRAKVISLLVAGTPIREIARTLRMSREAVRRVEDQRQRAPVDVPPAVFHRAAPERQPIVRPAISGEGIDMRDAPRHACAWPLWPNGSLPTFRCCGAPATPGRPYCAEHAARAYRKVEPVPAKEAA